MSSVDLVDMAQLPRDRPYVFARNFAKGQPTIMLLRRTEDYETWVQVWMRPFVSAEDQASTFYWLCSRVDDWPIWGALAARGGEEALDRTLTQERHRDDWVKTALS